MSRGNRMPCGDPAPGRAKTHAATTRCTAKCDASRGLSPRSGGGRGAAGMAAAPPLPVDPDAGFSRPRGVPALPGYKGLAVGDEVKENEQGTKYREVRLSDAEGGGKVGVSSKGFRALTTRPDGSWNMDSGLTMIL